jgi:hypothetical protein
MSKQQMNSADAAWLHSVFWCDEPMDIEREIIDAFAHELEVLARLRPSSTSKRERRPGVR